MNILKKLFKQGILLTTLSFSVTSCAYLDVVPPEQAGLQDATKTRTNALGFLHSCYAGILPHFAVLPTNMHYLSNGETTAAHFGMNMRTTLSQQPLPKDFGILTINTSANVSSSKNK